jgi:hypothetical protein
MVEAAVRGAAQRVDRRRITDQKEVFKFTGRAARQSAESLGCARDCQRP